MTSLYSGFAIETSHGRLFREGKNSDPSIFATRETAERRLARAPALKGTVVELVSGPADSDRVIEGYFVKEA